MGIFSHCDEHKFRFIDQLQRGWREQKQAIAGQLRGATAPKLVTDFVAIYRGTSVDAKSVLLVPTAAVIKSHSKAVKEVLLLVDRYEAPGERLFKPTKWRGRQRRVQIQQSLPRTPQGGLRRIVGTWGVLMTKLAHQSEE